MATRYEAVVTLHEGVRYGCSLRTVAQQHIMEHVWLIEWYVTILHIGSILCARAKLSVQ